MLHQPSIPRAFVFNLQLSPFCLQSFSLLHGQINPYSSALALEKSLMQLSGASQPSCTSKYPSSCCKVLWERVRLRLCLGLLRIRTSHARSHVLIKRSLQATGFCVGPWSPCCSARNTSHRRFSLQEGSVTPWTSFHFWFIDILSFPVGLTKAVIWYCI